MIFLAVLKFSESFMTSAKQILGIGAAIFLVIEGLKNTPGFAEVFNRYPRLAIIVNAALALCSTLGVCLTYGQLSTEFVSCVLTAVGVFLAAAGIHLVKTALSTGNTVSPALK